MINPSDPAMPRVAFDKDGTLTTFESEFSGIDIRTHISTMIMQGLVSHYGGASPVSTTKMAIENADALIAKLNEST